MGETFVGSLEKLVDEFMKFIRVSNSEASVRCFSGRVRNRLGLPIAKPQASWAQASDCVSPAELASDEYVQEHSRLHQSQAMAIRYFQKFFLGREQHLRAHAQLSES